MLTLVCLALVQSIMGATGQNQPPDTRGLRPATDAINDSGDALRRQTQYLYALILLFAFVSGAAWYSVYNAKKEEVVVQTTVKGPGGKPLPITKRKKRDDGERKLGPRFGPTAKNVFRYLAAVLFLSYVGTGVSMFIHAFWHENPYKWSKEGLPWAGEGSVVCFPSRTRSSVPPSHPALTIPIYIGQRIHTFLYM